MSKWHPLSSRNSGGGDTHQSGKQARVPRSTRDFRSMTLRSESVLIDHNLLISTCKYSLFRFVFVIFILLLHADHIFIFTNFLLDKPTIMNSSRFYLYLSWCHVLLAQLDAAFSQVCGRDINQSTWWLRFSWKVSLRLGQNMHLSDLYYHLMKQNINYMARKIFFCRIQLCNI
jgi:hypothetical protein